MHSVTHSMSDCMWCTTTMGVVRCVASCALKYAECHTTTTNTRAQCARVSGFIHVYVYVWWLCIGKSTQKPHALHTILQHSHLTAPSERSMGTSLIGLPLPCTGSFVHMCVSFTTIPSECSFDCAEGRSDVLTCASTTVKAHG